MDDAALEALLLDLESDRIERKASAADKDKIAEAICAFANDLPGHGQPGVILVGVHDDGSCAGLPVTDTLLLALADYRTNGNILPIPSLIVQKRVVNGCELAVVIVHPAELPPVRFRGRTMVRIGPRRAIATPEEERRLIERRRRATLPFDAQPVYGSSLDDLDLLLFQREYLPQAVAPEVLALNGRSIEHQLSALGLTAPDGTPTVTGLLALGRRPRWHFSGAYIQFVRFEGPHYASPIKDEKLIEGPLPDLLRRLEDVIRLNVTTRLIIGDAPREIRLPDYPVVALQQLVFNAILHRTYEGTNAPVRFYWFSDHVEITSPGGPFGRVTVANFGTPGIADYRNPHIGEVMRVLGRIQRFGIGLEMARQALGDNGNPPADFEVDDLHVRVFLHPRPDDKVSLSQPQPIG